MKTSVCALLVLAVLAIAAPAAAGTFEKDVPFALEEWIAVDSKEGPVTLHRLRLHKERQSAKSRIMRPGNSEYLQDIQIQLEYTNDATRDWEAKLRVEWLDENGVVIDGYNDEENLDSESRHDEATVTLSTLRYGLERAKKLSVRIEYHAE